MRIQYERFSKATQNKEFVCAYCNKKWLVEVGVKESKDVPCTCGRAVFFVTGDLYRDDGFGANRVLRRYIDRDSGLFGYEEI